MKGVVEVIPAKGRNIKVGDAILLHNGFSMMRMDNWIGPRPIPSESDYKPKPKRGLTA